MTKPMQPFNLGNIIAQADQIQGQRLNNQIAQSRLSQLNQPAPKLGQMQQVDGMPGYFAQVDPTNNGLVNLTQVKPSEAKLTTLDQNLRSAGYQPGTPEYQEKMNEYLFKPPAQTSVNVNNPQQTQEAKDYGSYLVKNLETLNTNAQAAESELQNLRIAKNIQTSAGALEPLKAQVAGFAQGLGFDPTKLGLEDATNAQAFTGIMKDLVLNKMASQKGPQTDQDAKRIETTLARLGNTPAANEFLFNAAIAIKERTIEQRNFTLRYRQQKGTLEGAQLEWEKYKRSTPLMGINPIAKQRDGERAMPIFYNQFRQGILAANPGVTPDQIATLWREKYGN